MNGAPIEQFSLERGVQQGDLFSSFLFILVMEGLKVPMSKALENGLYHGVRLPDIGRMVSLFQYANDLIFLGVGI